MSVEGRGKTKQRTEKRQKRQSFSSVKSSKKFLDKSHSRDKWSNKRKSVDQSEASEPLQKKAKSDDFTEIDFKVLLRDTKSIYSGLEKFIEAADKCTPGSGVYDIVDEFCRSSPDCAEITHLLDGEKKKLPELQLIFSCLEKILLRIASDLPQHASIGQKIVKRVLPLHAGSLYFTLHTNYRSVQIKTTVKLLVAMVMLGDNAARWVLTHFDFSNNCVKPLFSRRDIKDAEDVRTCSLHLILAFLLTGKSDIIRQTVEKKGVLAYMLEGLVYDRVATVQLVLTTVQEKVVQNDHVGVPAKLHVFTDWTLRQLGQLYTWKGPTKWKENLKVHGKQRFKNKKKDKEEVAMDTEEDTEDRRLLAEAAHKFLLEVCTSPTHGIFNTGVKAGRMEIQALSGFLQYLSIVSQHTLVQDLVIRILTVFPGQLPAFVARIAQHLSPRPHVKWVDMVNFLCKIYESQLVQRVLDDVDVHKPVGEVLTSLLQYTLPSTQVLTTVFYGPKDKSSLAITHTVMSVVRTIGQCAVRALEAVDRSSLTAVYSHEEVTDVVNLYKDAVIKALPNAQTIFYHWDKVQGQLTEKADKTELAQLKELCGVDVAAVLVRIEQVLCLYQDLNPTLLVKHSFALGKLLDGILNSKLSDADVSQESSESSHLPQLYLLKLLSGTGAARLPFGKQHSSHHTLMYQLLEMVPKSSSNPRMKQLTTQLLCKVLENTGSFESCYDELLVWLGQLQNYGCKSGASSTVLEFVAKVILRYMGTPFPYMDRVCDLMSEVAVMATGKPGGATSVDRQLQDILQIDITDLNADETASGKDLPREASKRFPFCPMLLVAVEILEKMENVHPDLKRYISTVVLDTFHLQVESGPLCKLAETFPRHLFVDGLLDYLQLWWPRSGTSPKKVKVAMVTEAGTLVTEEKMGVLQASLEPDIGGVAAVRQCLLHVSYVVMNRHAESAKDQLQKLTDKIEETVSQLVSAEEDLGNQSMTEDLPVLGASNTSSTKESAEKAVQLVLGHPTVRYYFYGEILEQDVGADKASRKVATSLTKLATGMLKTVKKNDLDVGSCGEYYQARMLECLKVLSGLEDSGRHLKHVYHGLKHAVDGLDAEKCSQVLDAVLMQNSLAEKDAISSSFYTITNVLLQKLVNLDKSLVKMTKTGAEMLVSCYTALEEASGSEQMVKYFTRFPNLAVFIEGDSLVGIMKSTVDTALVEVLITHNTRLRERFEEMIVSGEDCVDLDRHLTVILSYLKLVRLGNSERQEVLQKILSMYKAALFELCDAGDGDKQEQILQLCQQLIGLQALGDKTCKKLEKKLLISLSAGAAVLPHQVALLQALGEVTPNGSNPQQAGETIAENRRRLLVVCVEIMAKLMKKRASETKPTEDKLLDILDTFSKVELDGSTIGADIWGKFLKYSLKHYYTDPSMLKFLVHAAPVMFPGEPANTSVTVGTAVAMVMSHSSFFSVMFNEETEACKECLLDLLLVLVEMSSNSCNKEHLGVLLGAYSATLSTTDQKLLKLLQLYERNGVPFIDYKPFLWGEKAIQQQQLGGAEGATVHRQPGIAHVMASLDRQKLGDTILHFPTGRKLQSTEVQPAETVGSQPHCYDPCFLLPLLSHLLSSDSMVNCWKFVESSSLSFTLAALSSHDDAMRSAAYHVLERFKLHAEGARKFAEREQVLHVLRLLHDSVGGANTRLASIAAMFLARTVKLLLKPGTHMYGVINAFLMHKPRLDVREVPEFYKLFNSSAWEYKVERVWILSLMQEGLREEEDYKIFERRFIFKLLQAFYQASFADTECQVKVLEILRQACKVPAVARELTGRHGILAWLASVVTQTSPENHQQVSLLIDVVASLWSSLSRGAEGADKGQGQGQGHWVKPEMAGQVLTTLQSLLWRARSCSLESHLQLSKTLLSVLHHTAVQSTSQTSGTGLSCVDILVLLLQAGRFVSFHMEQETIINILRSLGYGTSLLESPKGDHSTYTDILQEQDAEELHLNTDEGKKDKKKEDETDEILSNFYEIKEKKANRKELQTELTETVAELILALRKITCSETVELTSAAVVHVTWLVGQLGQSGCSLKPDTARRALETVENIVCEEEINLLLEALVKSSDLSQYLVTALLNTYTNLTLTERTGDQSDGCHGNGAVRSLNNLLLAMGSRLLFGDKQQQQQMWACQLAPAASVGEVVYQSVLLRRLFLATSPSGEDLENLLSQRAPRKGDNLNRGDNSGEQRKGEHRKIKTNIVVMPAAISDDDSSDERQVVNGDTVESDDDDDEEEDDSDDNDDDSDDVSDDESCDSEAEMEVSN